MNPQALRDLLRRFMEAIAQVVESGEVLSDEFQGELAQTLRLILTRIQEVEQVGGGQIQPPPGGGGGEGLDQAMPSSNVEGFAYDDRTGRLLVRFLGRHPNRHGPIYAYQGVPANIFDIFRRGAIPARTDGHNRWGQWWRGKYPSMGAAMYHLIRAGGYPYQRIAG